MRLYLNLAAIIFYLELCSSPTPTLVLARRGVGKKSKRSLDWREGGHNAGKTVLPLRNDVLPRARLSIARARPDNG